MAKKVYELATELGIGAIELVEKLKSIGMNVRNHMVALSDEEVAKAVAAFDTAKQAAAPVKKAVVKKVVKKTAPVAEPVVEAPVVAAPVAEVIEEAVAAPVVEAPPAVAEEMKEPVKVKETIDDRPRGLVVIRKTKQQKEDERSAAAEAREVAAQEAAAAAAALEQRREEAASGVVKPTAKKEYFEEKMHSFTPIFTPEKKESTPGGTRSQALAPNPGFTGDEEEDEKNKKRMGDLAAMVSKKGAAKAKDLTQMRADEELKFASGLVGRTIYTPAKRKKVYSGPTQNTIITQVKDSKRFITVHDGCTAEELAGKLSLRFESFSNRVMEINLLVNPEDFIGFALASEIAALWNYRVENVAFDEDKVIGKAEGVDTSSLPVRSPVIAIMGHVDHGKTSLLDYIRKAKVADGEAGGITQHIGAYQVKVKDATLTFLDTPGHAAFANMRQRGADVTDIVVLVVAADDGVMPQTVESIKFCQNAKKPIIVAVNKMDKPGANPDKVKQGLMEYGLTPEEWGGETIYVPVSALKGTGVDDLLENIQIQAEVMELRADPKGSAEGIVIESKIEIGRGPVATLLIQRGTLNKGDSLVVGETSGRARSLMDFQGKMLDSAGPSTPIQVLGLEEVPNPGDILNVVKNEREAKKIAENRVNERKQLAQTKEVQVASLENFFAEAKSSSETGEKKVLNLVVRADVQGSFEAIKNAVERLGNDEVSIAVLGGGVGAITDSDVLLAASTKGYIIGFNMRPVTSARRIAEEKGVDIKTYSIIYEVINDLTLALEGMLTPESIEVYIGRAQVRDTFNIPKIGVVAGAGVIDGKIERGCSIRLLRDGKIVYDGKLSTLKRFKDEVKEVKNGYECGLGLENFNDVRVNDLVEAYIMETRKRTLESTQATL
jgi:translation initiation factor IF-2